MLCAPARPAQMFLHDLYTATANFDAVLISRGLSFSRFEGDPMADLLYLALGIAFFAATIGLVYAFDRLGRDS